MTKENINTGGPAFPRSMYSQNGPFNSSAYSEGYGMTLRDYFAAKAMAALLIDVSVRAEDLPSFAASAYMMADAMLKARGQQ